MQKKTKEKESAIEMFTSPVSYGTDLIPSFGPTTGIYLDGIKLMTNVRGRSFFFFFRLRVSARIEPNGLCQRQAYTTTSVVVAKMQRASAAGPNDGMH